MKQVRKSGTNKVYGLLNENIEEWASPSRENKDLYMPEPNRFVASDLSIRDVRSVRARSANVNYIPHIITNNTVSLTRITDYEYSGRISTHYTLHSNLTNTKTQYPMAQPRRHLPN